MVRSGLHPKVWWYCFTGVVRICHDGEIWFTSESMVVLLYRIGMDMSRW